MSCLAHISEIDIHLYQCEFRVRDSFQILLNLDRATASFKPLAEAISRFYSSVFEDELCLPYTRQPSSILLLSTSLLLSDLELASFGK